MKQKFMKALPWICLGIATLALLAAVVYVFGGAMPPSEEARAAYAQEVADGYQPPLPSSFVIPIPGCVCHSDNPSSVMRHSVRHLAECGACHARR